MFDSTNEGFSKVVVASAVVVITLVAYCRFYQPSRSSEKAPLVEHSHVVKEIMTAEELAAFDGEKEGLPILLGINGKIYDVTKGKDYYGKEGGYHVMAGKDASRLLAKNLLDPRKDNGQPLTDTENQQLKQWQDFFENKYKVVGVLAPKAA